MKHKKYLILSFLSLLFISCDNGTIDPNSISYYPLEPNLEWEYSTVMKTEYYDSLGNIANTITDTLGNSIVNIESLNDTLPNFDKLVRMVSYESSTADSKVTSWYENKNYGLYQVAYKNAGASQPVMPKIVNGRKYINVNDLKKISLLPDFNLRSVKATDDSVQYFLPARKVLAFPIEVGTTWNELQKPFYRDRTVEDEEKKIINGVSYSVYKISSTWDEFNNFDFNDYVSTKYGLLLREVLADSVVSTSPDGTINGFLKITSYSKIVRRNF